MLRFDMRKIIDQEQGVCPSKFYTRAGRPLVILCFLVLILGCLGCRKKQGHLNQEVQAPRINQLLCEEQLSSLTDISLPMGLTKHQFKNTDVAGQHVIDYYSSFQPPIMQDFYELDMERLGWRLLSKFATPDRILLLFDKPHTWCIVTIYAHAELANTASKTTISISPKAINTNSI